MVAVYASPEFHMKCDMLGVLRMRGCSSLVVSRLRLVALAAAAAAETPCAPGQQQQLYRHL